MKNITILFWMIVFISINTTLIFGQTEIYAPVDDVLPATKGLEKLNSSCSSSSAAYINRYRKNSAYVPNANTPIKTIKIAFHFFQKSDGSNNWQDDATTTARLNNIVNIWINDIMGNICPPSDPIPGVPFISHSTIQYEIAGVYFYQDDDLNISINQNDFENEVMNIDPSRLDKAIPIYVTSSTQGGFAGFSIFPSESNLSQNSFVVSKFGTSNPSGDYVFATHLAHELGHALDLKHTYNSDILLKSHYNYKSDVYETSWWNYCNPPTGYSCYHKSGFNCDPYQIPENYCTNNLMGGTQFVCYLAPSQMGEINKALALKSVRKYVKEMDTHTGPWLVSQDETWDFDIQIYQDIFVTNGATLTIKCKVGMANRGKILVDRGARLIIDGGEVTSWGTMWEGIHVWGTSTKKQSIASNGLSPDHGIVKIFNQGTIKNAYTGISTIKEDAFGNFDWAYTGGIIQCDGANFINNQRAIQYYSYHNKLTNTSSTIIPNVGYFYRSLFETNDLLKDPLNQYPTAFIKLFDVEGIRFHGNTYQNNSATLPDHDKRGEGINSIDASYSLSPHCACINPITGECGCVTPSVFKNLQYGVISSGLTPVHDISIHDNDFIHCNRSILMSGVDYADISKNRIDVGDGINTFSSSPYAIYNDHCHGYTIKGNEITTTIPGNTIATGIAFNGSGGLGNKLLNNQINNMGVGTVVYGDNRGLSPGEGLLIKCNDYGQNTVNTYDIAMLWSTGGAQGRIDEFQGTPTEGANNKFSHNCIGTQNDFYDWFNDPGTYPVQYFYNDDQPLERTKPKCYSPVLMPIGLNAPYTSSMCSGPINPIIGSTTNILELIEKNTSQIIQKQQLLKTSSSKSRANEIKGQIAELNFEKAFAIDRKITSLLNDIIKVSSQDSIIILMRADNRINAGKKLLSAYIKFGKYDEANQLLARMADLNEISDHFYQMQKLVLRLKQNPEEVNILKHDEAIKALIEKTIAENGPAGSNNAQALLQLLYDYKYDEYISLPPSDGSIVEEEDSEITIRTSENAEMTSSLVVSSYPNPFNHTTTIEFSLSQDSEVTLSIFDSQGRFIKSLINQQNRTAGIHTIAFEAGDLQAGVYIFHLKTKEAVQLGRLVLML